MIVDTHCHFDMYSNPIGIVNESERKNIITIGMTNLPSHFNMGISHIKDFKFIRLALGMHPLLASYHNNEFSLFYKYLDKTSYIGEVGLDFSREGIETKKIQIQSFEKILEAISTKKKILSIHSRRAEKEVLKYLKKYEIENVIFHWYSGGLKLIDEIVEAGYYLSINTAMIKSKNGQKIINRIPNKYLLTETDGPYINIGKRTVKPSDLKLVLEYFQQKKVEDHQQAEKIVYQNFMRIIKKIK